MSNDDKLSVQTFQFFMELFKWSTKLHVLVGKQLPKESEMKRHGHLINQHLKNSNISALLLTTLKSMSHLNVIKASQALDKINVCISDIRRWMILNKLKINDAKTELIVFRSPMLKHDLSDLSVNVGGNLIRPSVKVRDLGVILDRTLSLDDHISAIWQSAHFHISNIDRIRNLLSLDACATLIHALIGSRLDYCNSLLYNIYERLKDCKKCRIKQRAFSQGRLAEITLLPCLSSDIGWRFGREYDIGPKEYSLHVVGLLLLNAAQIVLTPPAPRNGARFYRFFWAGRPSGPAGWLALLLLKTGDVETNPGPKHTRTQVWICDICHREITRKQTSLRCNHSEHWVHLRCTHIRVDQYTDTWICHLHRGSRLPHATYTSPHFPLAIFKPLLHSLPTPPHPKHQTRRRPPLKCPTLDYPSPLLILPLHPLPRPQPNRYTFHTKHLHLVPLRAFQSRHAR